MPFIVWSLKSDFVIIARSCSALKVQCIRANDPKTNEFEMGLPNAWLSIHLMMHSIGKNVAYARILIAYLLFPDYSIYIPNELSFHSSTHFTFIVPIQI